MAELQECVMIEQNITAFDWVDAFAMDDQLSDEERMVRDTAEAYAQDKLQPRVTQAYVEDRFDRAIMSEMGELGLLGPPSLPNMAAPASTMSATA